MSVATGPCTWHYNSDLSIWLSVDPMSDKYPSTSPYAYCANNPVKLVDPDGRDIWIDGYLYTPGQACPEGVAENTQKKWNALNTICQNKRGEAVISDMSSSDYIFDISSAESKTGVGAYVRGDCETHPGGTIYLNGHDSDIGIIAHELFHGYQHMNGQLRHTIFNEVEAYLFSFSITGNISALLFHDDSDCPDDNIIGNGYNNAIIQLCYGSDFDSNSFDYACGWFQVCSPSNYRGTYNEYLTTYPEKYLITDFFPLSDYTLPSK